MVESIMEEPSDAGSIPASSICCNASEGGIAYADAKPYKIKAWRIFLLIHTLKDNIS